MKINQLVEEQFAFGQFTIWKQDQLKIQNIGWNLYLMVVSVAFEPLEDLRIRSNFVSIHRPQEMILILSTVLPKAWTGYLLLHNFIEIDWNEAMLK